MSVVTANGGPYEFCASFDPSADRSTDNTFVPDGQYGLAGHELGSYTGTPWWEGCINAFDGR